MIIVVSMKVLTLVSPGKYTKLSILFFETLYYLLDRYCRRIDLIYPLKIAQRIIWNITMITGGILMLCWWLIDWWCDMSNEFVELVNVGFDLTIFFLLLFSVFLLLFPAVLMTIQSSVEWWNSSIFSPHRSRKSRYTFLYHAWIMSFVMTSSKLHIVIFNVAQKKMKYLTNYKW